MPGRRPARAARVSGAANRAGHDRLRCPRTDLPEPKWASEPVLCRHDEDTSFAARFMQTGVPTELHVNLGGPRPEAFAPQAALSQRIWHRHVNFLCRWTLAKTSESSVVIGTPPTSHARTRASSTRLSVLTNAHLSRVEVITYATLLSTAERALAFEETARRPVEAASPSARAEADVDTGPLRGKTAEVRPRLCRKS